MNLAPWQIPDDPNRVAPPDYGPTPKVFESYDIREQLDAADTICRRKLYAEARSQALPESAAYEEWLKKLLDYSNSDADLVREARQIILTYLQSVAHHQGEDLADFI